MEAQFEYKCRRCGKIYRNPCCSPEIAFQILVEIQIKGVGGDNIHGGRVFLHSSHFCKDGGTGLADLLGYRVVKTK